MCNLENKDKCILYIDNPIKDLKQFSEELQMYKNEVIGELLYKDIVFPRGFDFTMLPTKPKKFYSCKFYEQVLLEGKLKFFHCHFFEFCANWYFDNKKLLIYVIIHNCSFENNFSLASININKTLINYISISHSKFKSGLDIHNIEIGKLSLKIIIFIKQIFLRIS